MVDTKIKTTTIDGAKIDVYVDKDGQFYAINYETREGVRYQDGMTKADTLKKLEDKLRKQRRLNRVSVPVTLIAEPSWRSDKPVSAWNSTRPLPACTPVRVPWVTVSTGERESLGGYGDGQVCRRLSEEELAGLQALWDAKVAAADAWDQAFKDVQINEKEAIEAAAAKQPETVTP